jgi:formyltetrahydrofolate deformylase
VVSNHPDFAALAAFHQLPFHQLSITPDTKEAAEAEILRIINDADAELLVLARYMQVLSPELAGQLEGRCINIHHSFLPSFKGAKPYHQAHARGVKIIGATAHYVTADLDEGPIIEQSVERVSHAHTPADLIETGQDLESTTLARAVRWHCQRRVTLSGKRTVVFR